MRLHVHFLSAKAHSLSFQPEPLFQGIVTAQFNFAARS
jgi:hypothetical protein